MAVQTRRFLLIVAGVVALAAVVWASRFDSLPPAEMSFQNFSDPKTLDPHRATGEPESRLIFSLFSGLLEMLPDGDPDPDTGLQPMTPQPALASHYDVSDDRKRFVFHLRDDIQWSDGTPITSADFVWSWTRMLHPTTACEYNYQLFCLPYAEQYATGKVDVGDRVEVELWDRPGESKGSEPNPQAFPRGTILYGTVRSVGKPREPVIPEDASKEDREEILGSWREKWVFEIELADVNEDGDVDWDRVTGTRRFAVDADSPVATDDTTHVHAVLVALDKLGVMEAPDPQTFIVNLKDPLPYFPSLVAYYPLFPVPRHVVEEHGMPMWTKPENIVTNGAYLLDLRRLRDRVRLRKNPRWYNAEQVQIELVDAMSTEGQNTALNMYETGQIDWVTDPPSALMKELRERDDFVSAPQLTVYFYRLNTRRKPLHDPRVRRAIAMAINRTQIVNEVTKAGQQPAYSLVPPGIAGYESPIGFKPDLDEAKRLLREAGFPNGRGIPKMTVLYNTSEGHRAIAEVVQQQVQNNLNIKLELQNMEWGSFLDKVNQKDYDIARAGWVADYSDPNTFLDMWMTGGPQNNTHWSNARFDQLIRDSASEVDSAKRMQLLQQAEAIWIEEMPVIPIYFYQSINIISPKLEGFFPTPQDKHPLHLLRFRDGAEASR